MEDNLEKGVSCRVEEEGEAEVRVREEAGIGCVREGAVSLKVRRGRQNLIRRRDGSMEVGEVWIDMRSCEERGSVRSVAREVSPNSRLPSKTFVWGYQARTEDLRS